MLDNNFEAWDLSRHLGRLDRDQMVQLSRGCHILYATYKMCQALPVISWNNSKTTKIINKITDAWKTGHWT